MSQTLPTSSLPLAAQRNIEILQGFSELILEEFKRMHPGWCYVRGYVWPSAYPNVAFVARIDARPLPFPGQNYDPIEEEEYLHYFRVELRLSDGLTRADLPWQQGYVGRPHLYAKLVHGRSWDLTRLAYNYENGKEVGVYCDTGNIIDWTPDMRVACQKILWHLEDPDCHVKLAEKVRNAVGYYMLTKMVLPDH